jgi:hypothetical protein
VFEKIVATAARALRCDMAVMLVRDGGVYVHTAAATPEGLMTDFAPEQFPIDASANFPSRAFLGKTMLHLPDWSQIDLPKHERWVHETFGIASALYWPLLRGDECIAVLVFVGRRANSFGSSEIAQAESFRDQAVIAMENAVCSTRCRRRPVTLRTRCNSRQRRRRCSRSSAARRSIWTRC